MGDFRQSITAEENHRGHNMGKCLGSKVKQCIGIELQVHPADGILT